MQPATSLGKISLNNGAEQSVEKLGVSGIKIQLFGAIELVAAVIIMLHLVAPQLAIVSYCGYQPYGCFCLGVCHYLALSLIDIGLVLYQLANIA